MNIEERAEEYFQDNWNCGEIDRLPVVMSYEAGAEDQKEIMKEEFRTFLATFTGAAPASYIQREFEKGMENRLKYQQEEPEV